MTAVVMGRHTLNRTPDGLVTAFAGDLAGDVPTRIMPVIGGADERTARRWLPVLDEVEAIVGAPPPDPDPDVWAPLLDAAEAFDDTAAEHTPAPAVLPGRYAPVTPALLDAVVRGLRRL